MGRREAAPPIPFLEDVVAKIMIHSNAPSAPTGYANQVALFAPLLKAAGHEVVVSAFYGLQGAEVVADGIRVVPGGYEDYGNDILRAHVEAHQPDLIWTLIDAWVLWPDTVRDLPVAMWAPVDCDPIPPPTVAALRTARWPVAYSRFGEREMRRAGLDALYVPHGVDCDLFAPADRGTARQQWSVPDDVFLAVTVAANKGLPSRKGLDRLLKAWARFAETRRDVLLYVHTFPLPNYNGLDLLQMARFYGCEDTVRFPDMALFATGGYTPPALAALYNAADVFVLPSMGEGFGIPLVEAQACGCPVITTDFTAQAELVFSGWTIPVEWADRVWTFRDSEQASVKPSAILAALEKAYAARGDEALREQAREGAQAYDARRVFGEYMQPVMARMLEEVGTAEVADARVTA